MCASEMDNKLMETAMEHDEILLKNKMKSDYCSYQCMNIAKFPVF